MNTEENHQNVKEESANPNAEAIVSATPEVAPAAATEGNASMEADSAPAATEGTADTTQPAATEPSAVDAATESLPPADEAKA